MKNYTYEDFASGEIAIWNDSPERTQQVIKKAFPKAELSGFCINLYYTSNTWPVDQWDITNSNEQPKSGVVVPASQISLEPREKEATEPGNYPKVESTTIEEIQEIISERLREYLSDNKIPTVDICFNKGLDSEFNTCWIPLKKKYFKLFITALETAQNEA